ncbi:MAG: hypothetical protein IPP15_14105 [Saprospiraceae bacterium]|uniref:DUF4870 domain-containing protein n=1 Tax=Candidatus Opimibacter skivensis TaxID=2982028 RepID=A0A9D7SWK4_9BACT|nr:hypothetical protein [Candidatus Opimibacter skivensis]
MDDKTKSIVAHLTLIGWIIALVMNQSDKGPNTSYYLRQMLGLTVLGVLSWLVGMVPVPYLSMIFSIVILVLWVLSLVSALSGQQKPVPVVGEMFQQWFKSIS